jgi:hypothetical protein
MIRQIETAHNDKDLLAIVTKITLNNNTPWLVKYIRVKFLSTLLIDHALGLTLASFMNDSDGETLINEYSANNSHNTWVYDQINYFKTRFNRNLWAKHWFSLFVTEDDNIKAGGYFNLFLECLDKRFEIWQKSDENKITGYDKQVHYALNIDGMNKRIEKVNKDLGKVYLSQKIHSGSVYPWVLDV